MNRFQFVADHLDTFEVKRLCALVEIGRSSFYAWLKGIPARQQRVVDDAQLAARIRAVHESDPPAGRRGSPPSSTTAPGLKGGSTTSASRG